MVGGPNWLSRWTEPSPLLQSPKERRQARLLAGLTLVMTGPIIVLSAAILIIATPETPFYRNFEIYRSIVINLVVAVPPYILSRTRYFRWGAVHVIALSSLGLFSALLVEVDDRNVIAAPYFMAISLVICGLLLPARATMFFTAFDVTLVLVAVPFSGASADVVGPQVMFLVITGVLVTIAAWVLDTEARERSRAEEEAQILGDELMQHQRLQTLGTLAGGAAHEINNPIHAILNYSDLLRAEAGEEHRVEFARIIQEQSVRVADILQRMLSFSGVSFDADQQAEDLAEIVSESLVFLQPMIQTDQILVHYEPPTEPIMVRCIRPQMVLVVTNLVRNARDSLVERFSGPDPDKTLEISLNTDENEVRVAFVDNGVGIPEETREKMLQAFYTTKGAGAGTGMGLAICDRIISAHGGSLAFVPDRGAACFEVTLNRVTD